MMWLVLVGFLSGVIGGMGIGGGAILIPVLTIFMGFSQKTAQTINLLYFIPTAVIALIKHNKNKRIEKTVLTPIILSGVVGCVIGSYIALNIDNAMLKKMFGVFLLVMGLREIWVGKKVSGMKTNSCKQNT